jgi:hypothetical protein
MTTAATDTNNQQGAAQNQGGKQDDTTGDDADLGGDIHERAARELVSSLKNPDVFKDGLYFGKFKNIEEAGKGFKELKTAFDKKAKVAPETYDVSKFKIDGVDDFEFDPEHGLSKVALPFLKKIGATQEEAEELINQALKAQYVNPRDELKKIHENEKEAISIFQGVKKFVADNVPKELQDEAERFTETAAGVKLIRFFMEERLDREIPDSAANGSQAQSYQEMMDAAFDYKEKHKKTIRGNPDQQAEYNRLMEKASRAKLDAQKIKR